MQSRGRRIAKQSARAALGVIVGLCVAEGVFCVRQQGAFPHLNVYAPDPKLGVRLRPHARQRVAFGGNPVTEVRINAAGFRGAELPQPSVDDVLVVGDSQVFGLGVEESQTFAAALAGKIGKTVVNAGVPTYGPLEFHALLEEQLPVRKPRTVLYVVNLANDLFEANRPNAQRHAVWDGWAVRHETAPARLTEFPGRAWLFRESHLVFALRRLLHRNDDVDFDAPLPSEGSSKDLVVAANAARVAKTKEEDTQLAEWEANVHKAVDEALAAQRKLQAEGQKAFPDVFAGVGGKEYLKKNGHPADIVSEKVYLSEATFGPHRRVKIALEGAKIRQQVEALLKKRAEDEIEKAESKAILATFEERAKLEKKIAELRTLPAKLLRTHSPLYPALEKVKKLCDAHHARLVVVILPMDVQVSDGEWNKYDSKYGEERADLAPTKILSDDIVRAGEALGVTVIDTMEALVKASPGAFLHADLHLSPKGHAAVAEAITSGLGAPPPVAAATIAGPALGFTKVCACHKSAGHPTCDGVTAAPDLDCVRTFGADCAKLLACVAGSLRPKCLPGFANHGAHHRCFQTCGADHACAVGKCSKAKEGSLCL